MKIISFIEDHDIIKQILVHLNIWMNHDPPDDTIESVVSSDVLVRSFEWWETTNNDGSYQQPFYEDNFSQETSYED